jgi:hypothetical protein
MSKSGYPVGCSKAKDSRLIIGGNPFSGFSHQGNERDQEMIDWYTASRIKEAYRQAEELGIMTHIGRADHHIMRVLREYWNEGGKIQWIAQTCPELGTIEQGVQNAIAGEAKACYIHGGVMDFLFAQKKLGEVPPEIARIRAALPTIQHALAQSARLLLASHLGRPKGEAKDEFSLAPVGKRLEELLKVKIKFISVGTKRDEIIVL